MDLQIRQKHLSYPEPLWKSPGFRSTEHQEQWSYEQGKLFDRWSALVCSVQQEDSVVNENRGLSVLLGGATPGGLAGG